MNGILMEEPETQPESKRRGIRIEKPEGIRPNREAANPVKFNNPAPVPAVFPVQRRIHPFLRFLIFLTYLFSAATLYLAFRAVR